MTAQPQRRRSRAANTVLRRQQLIDATIESVSQVGFSETTLAKVAAIAGLSQGIVVFRFGTKEELLVETLKYLTEEYRQAWTSALEMSEPDPIARLCAIVAADFLPKLVSRKKLAVWHAFYGEAKGHPPYLDICGARDEEHAAALRQVLGEVAGLNPRPDSFDIAVAADMIEGLSDGLWLQMLLSKPGLDRNVALDLMFRQLETLLPAQAEPIRSRRRDSARTTPRRRPASALGR